MRSRFPPLPRVLGACAFLSLALPAEARLRAIRDTDFFQGQPTTVKIGKKEEPKRWFFNYYADFSGPSADFALPLESYSPATDDYTSMALFQSVNFAYAWNADNRVGIEIGANQPLQKEVLDRTYETAFAVYNPTIYYKAFNLFQTRALWVNARFGFDLPTSEFAQQSGLITTYQGNFNFNFRLADPRWSFAINHDHWFNFFEDNLGYTRLSMDIGPEVGYVIDRAWSINSTALFDFGFISQGDNAYQYSAGSVDRFTFTLRYQPVPDVVQFGLYAQVPVFSASAARSAVGLNFNLWL